LNHVVVCFCLLICVVNLKMSCLCFLFVIGVFYRVVVLCNHGHSRFNYDVSRVKLKILYWKDSSKVISCKLKPDYLRGLLDSFYLYFDVTLSFISCNELFLR